MMGTVKRYSMVYAFVFLLYRCGVAPVIEQGGGGSETIAVVVADSTVRGTMTASTDAGNSLMQGATVKLFDKKYLPMNPCSKNNFYDSTVSDGAGGFRFLHINPGSYRVYAHTAASGTSVLTDTFLVRSGAADTLHDTLSRSGAVTGRVFSITKSNDTVKAPVCYVFIMGTQFKCLTDTAGDFALDGLPQGTYMLLGVPASLFSPVVMDTVVDKPLPDYIKDSNKNGVADTVKPGETITGKAIYLTP